METSSMKPEKRILRLTVNGSRVEVAAEPRRLLLDLLRDDLGLTGLKKACDIQVCGSCTVLVNGAAVSACTSLAFDAEGAEVVTIEGLSENGRLDILQRAFIQYGAIQCGYCIPGMIMMARSLLNENPSPSEDEIRLYMSGNLCRCTGYKKIVEAIRAAAGGDVTFETPVLDFSPSAEDEEEEALSLGTFRVSESSAGP